VTNKKNPAITARRQARERLAQERAEQAERNRNNEADLTDYLVAEQQIAQADADRDAAINDARERHGTVVREWKLQQRGCVARMSDRGETSTVIADRTGLTIREIKQLISHVPEQKREQANAPATDDRSVQLARSVAHKPSTLRDGDLAPAGSTNTTEGEVPS